MGRDSKTHEGAGVLPPGKAPAACAVSALTAFDCERLHGFGRIERRIVELFRPFGVELRAFWASVPRDAFDAAVRRRRATAERRRSRTVFLC